MSDRILYTRVCPWCDHKAADGPCPGCGLTEVEAIETLQEFRLKEDTDDFSEYV